MSGKKKQRKLKNRRNNRRRKSQKKESGQELEANSRELLPAGQSSTLPDHLTARPLRRATLLQMQQEHGNAYVQRVLDSQENGRLMAADVQLEDEESEGESKPARARRNRHRIRGGHGPVRIDGQGDPG